MQSVLCLWGNTEEVEILGGSQETEHFPAVIYLEPRQLNSFGFLLHGVSPSQEQQVDLVVRKIKVGNYGRNAEFI